MVLTSVVFPQVPLPEVTASSMNLPSMIGNQTYHISFSTTESNPSEMPLSRTPTPHHKELRRLRNILRSSQPPDAHTANISEIKEAKVTNISASDLLLVPTLNQHSLLNNKNRVDDVIDGGDPEDVTISLYKSIKGKQSPSSGGDTTPKQPPPYHIAAAYSKNAHLFAQICPPSPHDQPKQFSQQQPLNIHHPTPKFAKKQHTENNVDKQPQSK